MLCGGCSGDVVGYDMDIGADDLAGESGPPVGGFVSGFVAVDDEGPLVADAKRRERPSWAAWSRSDSA